MALQFGGEDDGAWRAGQYGSLDSIRNMGGSAMRLVISRERVARDGWAQFDNAINAAHQRGIQPQVVLDNFEGFSGLSQARHGAGDPRKYEKFVKEAATHFKGRVGTYSLVNEPDLKMAPQKYRELFVRGQKALNKTDKNARVLFGEFSPHGGLDYAKRVIGNKGIVASGVAMHPYQENDPLAPPTDPIPGGDNEWKWGIGRGRTMQKTIKGLNVKTRANKTPGLYYTEFGYSHSNPNASTYWPRALQAAERAGVKQVIAYTMTGSPGSAGGWDTGLFNPDGTTRPSYDALMKARGTNG